MIGIVLFTWGIVLMVVYLLWFCFGQSKMPKAISVIINVVMLMLSIVAFVVCITVHSRHPVRDEIEPMSQPDELETLSEAQLNEPESTINVPWSELETLQIESTISEMQTDILDIQHEESEMETIGSNTNIVQD